MCFCLVGSWGRTVKVKCIKIQNFNAKELFIFHRLMSRKKDQRDSFGWIHSVSLFVFQIKLLCNLLTWLLWINICVSPIRRIVIAYPSFTPDTFISVEKCETWSLTKSTVLLGCCYHQCNYLISPTSNKNLFTSFINRQTKPNPDKISNIDYIESIILMLFPYAANNFYENFTCKHFVAVEWKAFVF